MKKISESIIMIYLEGDRENTPSLFIGRVKFNEGSLSGRVLGISNLSLDFLLKGRSVGTVVKRFEGEYGESCIVLLLGEDVKIELIIKPAFRAGKLHLFAGNYQSSGLTFGAAYVIRM